MEEISDDYAAELLGRQWEAQKRAENPAAYELMRRFTSTDNREERWQLLRDAVGGKAPEPQPESEQPPTDPVLDKDFRHRLLRNMDRWPNGRRN